MLVVFIVTSNKTIQGADSNATIDGDLYIGNGVNNVIVQNLNFTNPSNKGEGDGITIKQGNNVFINHCTFTDCTDGEIDFAKGSDSITISWCRFRYITQSTHRNVNLIGASDSDSLLDRGRLHITFHHCWWDQLCTERMPSVRFGRAHVYNNYYSAVGNNYCVRTRLYAECLVENNYFENVQNPWELLTTSGTPNGKLYAANNNVSYLDSSNGVKWVSGWYPGQLLIPGTDTVFTPPYSYTLDSVQNVKDIVMAGAGNKGKGGPDGVGESPVTVTRFSLDQNYPNPFNPTTAIIYQLPGVGTQYIVSLKVYDIYGREVAVLADGVRTAGKHQVLFNGTELSSGVYFAQLKSGTFSKTIKLILAK